MSKDTDKSKDRDKSKDTNQSKDGDQMKTMPPNGHQSRKRQKDPEWALGLRRLYDSVVEEPLPDSFMDLLDQLDSRDDG